MPILERQVRKRTEMVTRKILREGRIPTALEVALDVGTFIRENAGLPTMRPQMQARSQVWDHSKTNDVLEAIAFDLGIAYDEALGTLQGMVQRYSRVELSYAAQRFQLAELISLLRNLLFVSKNAEDNFFGVYDTFDDLSKVNVDLTTRDCVDLNEGVALLPPNDVIADRVDMRHLYSRGAWPVSATVPAEEVTGEPTEGAEGPEKPSPPPEPSARSIVQNEPAPNAGFGLAFSDMINSWRQVITSDNGRGVTIEFTVPMGTTDVESKAISQVSMNPDMAHVSKLRLFHSLDNVNYTKFPNIPEEVALEPGKVRRLDFETTRCRYVRFLVTLDTPTTVNGASHTYIFGFKNIAFYKLGRAQEAEVVSTALSASSMGKPIDRVSLSITDLMPAGCNAQYFVAPADVDGLPREGIWRPITAITKMPVEGIPQVVKFSESGLKSIVLPPPTVPVIERTVRAVDYYQLTATALVEEPLFRQAFLYRGENAWWRNTQRERITRAVRDNFIDFNSGDVQSLYVATTEIAAVADNTASTTGSTATILSVSNPVDYDPSTMQLKAPSNVDPEVDQRPRYAIYQVLMFRDQMTVEDEAITLTGTTWSQLANSGITALGSGRPAVTNVGGTVTYLEGIDYELESATDGTLTGKIRRIDTPSLTSNIASGASVEVTYDLDPDITHLVRSIDGHDIKLSKNMSGPADQYFQVTYRFVPLPPNNEVKKATLNVSQKYGETLGETYQEGRDFLVDSKSGTITRIPGGEIKGDKVVFVDFRYEQRPRDLDTFSSWFYVDIREPFVVEINPLDLDLETGERLIIDSIDMSRRTSLGEFTPGWHKITVRSKRPEAFNNAAVKQVAGLLDRSGEPVFIAGGPYFTQMKASRIPMLQRSVTQLTKNTAKTDHGYFAITPQKHVIINFEPGSTEEIYTYGIRYVSGSMQTGTWAEQFRLEYTHALTAAEPVEKVLFKALLTRDKNTEAGMTPRLFEYHLRLG